MFVNLFLSSSAFKKHNFNYSLAQVSGPAHGVAEAMRLPKGRSPDPELFEILEITLSARCCQSFIRENPQQLSSARDYYLSKLYQFFIVALLEESDHPTHLESFPQSLERILDQLFPDDSDDRLLRLDQLDWRRLFSDARRDTPEALVKNLPRYLPEISRPESLETPEEVIDRLRRSRTIEKLAEEAGINPKQVYRVKSGLNVKTETITKLAKALGCSPGDLFWR